MLRALSCSAMPQPLCASFYHPLSRSNQSSYGHQSKSFACSLGSLTCSMRLLCRAVSIITRSMRVSVNLHFHLCPQTVHSQKVVSGSSAERV